MEGYSNASDGLRTAVETRKLRFANKCVAEEAGTRTMRRVAAGAVDAELRTLGYDGSSSLLSGAAHRPCARSK